MILMPEPGHMQRRVFAAEAVVLAATVEYGSQEHKPTATGHRGVITMSKLLTFTIAVVLTVTWIACAIVTYSNGKLWMLLVWSLLIPGVMVPWLIWMRWHYKDEVHVSARLRPRRSPHLSRHQQQAALRPLLRLSRQLTTSRPSLVRPC